MVGIAQLVSAPDCGSGGPGFESLYPPYGVLAQSVEHLTFNQVVRGSNPRCLMNEETEVLKNQYFRFSIFKFFNSLK